jgi:3-mercaptopyruvate sulfurtransferase SseA
MIFVDNQARSHRPILLILLGAILIVFAIILVLLNPAQQTSVLPDASMPTESVYPEIPRVSLKDAKAAYDAKTAVFVDARTGDSYNTGHIPGALSIPADQIAQHLAELNKNDWIITYCT